ncbi:hypothetical protein L226DRAFT_70751 [Lentinus tigrinus ALCF2SS1-7]|uniref:uncharacterized protein n=1 Tax=Lentinus tigrinus ALCF2SS1-7 TaxID=1328758 RepID=UPI0011662554|nr:hypothetical protein L226DRAFT_70751 [Lentinus tigrinus ALCF2SS1-7]
MRLAGLAIRQGQDWDETKSVVCPCQVGSLDVCCRIVLFLFFRPLLFGLGKAAYRFDSLRRSCIACPPPASGRRGARLRARAGACVCIERSRERSTRDAGCAEDRDRARRRRLLFGDVGMCSGSMARVSNPGPALRTSHASRDDYDERSPKCLRSLGREPICHRWAGLVCEGSRGCRMQVRSVSHVRTRARRWPEWGHMAELATGGACIGGRSDS